MPGIGWLETDRFARLVQTSGHRWAGGTGTKRLLRMFDEAGIFQPTFRIVYPESFVSFQREGWRYASVGAPELTKEDRSRFLEAEQLLTEGLRHYDDPQASSPLESGDGVLRDFLVPVVPGERVEWLDWEVEVYDPVSERTVRPSRAFAYYAPWQFYRFWALLHAYTFVALLDPRIAEPDDVSGVDWEGRLGDGVSVLDRGSGRPLALARELDEDRWVEGIHRTREAFSWCRLRIHRPHEVGWVAGTTMDLEERAATSTTEFRDRCDHLPGIRDLDEDTFLSRCRALLEFWCETENAAPAFRHRVAQDLGTCQVLAYHKFDREPEVFEELVGPLARQGHRRVRHALRPDWGTSRDEAESDLRHYVESFNALGSRLRLEQGDHLLFLDYLDSSELYSWQLEFAQAHRAFRSSTDLSLTRQLLHLRSLAANIQPLLQQLVTDFGEDRDHVSIASWDTRRSYGVFLSQHGGWRETLWQFVAESWHLTQTVGTQFEDQLLAIREIRASTDMSSEIVSAARPLLRSALLRNYTSHRDPSREDWIGPRWGELLHAVVQTSLFYWRVGTDPTA